MKTILGWLLIVTTTALAAPKIEEQIVAPPWEAGTILTLSPKGMRVASVHKRDGKWVVSINGAESPAYDEVFLAAPNLKITYQNTGAILGVDILERGPVAFSPDGSRYAYAARQGEEVVAILDGKEIFRAKRSLSAPPVQLLQFTPDSKHVYFYNPSGDTMRSFRLLMNGKPVTPAFDQTPPLLFSEDGSRWLLQAGKAKQPSERMIIVDGKVADYTGVLARFTPDGKHVTCVAKTDTEHQLLRDGKPVLTRKGELIDSYKVSATGDIYAIVKHGAGKTDLYRNGKLVENATGVYQVVLSSDGKRYAAHGSNNLGASYWVVLDGKQGPEFQTITDIRFSADSTVCAYRGQRADGWHLVANGVEDPQGHGVMSYTFAQTGNSLVYVAGPQPLAAKVYHKGKVSPQHRNVLRLEISPNGERVAYSAPRDANTSEFVVDGEVKGLGGAFGETAVFSPDSQHIAAVGRSATSHTTVFINNRHLPEKLGIGQPQAFTPDSQHLISRARATDAQGHGALIYYLDGEPVAKFGGRYAPWVNSPKMVRQDRTPVALGIDNDPPDPNAVDWEVQPDGSIIFVGSASGPTPTAFGPVKLVRVTPEPGSHFLTGLDRAEALYQKSIADAAAAKAQAAAEAAAAKQKAADEAAAAAAKRKADYEAAVAAKNKAREDAFKLKTLNIQRARQGLPPLKELPE